MPALTIGLATLHPGITHVVLGLDSVEQVDANLDIAEGPPIPVEVWREAKQLGLLDAGVPVPE